MMGDHDDIDDGFDDDLYNEEDGFSAAEGGGERVGFKETWEGNPLLKIAAVILGVSLLAGAYLTFSGDDDTSENISMVSTRGQDAKITPGKEDVDPVYREAVEQANMQEAERAQITGGSVLPTPIASEKTSGIEIPDAPLRQEIDPLEEWRTRAEGSRSLRQDVSPQEDDLPPQPDLVPMVQPIRPQQVIKMDPEQAKSLGAQMRTIISSQVPQVSALKAVTREESLYIKEKENQKILMAERAKQPGGALSGILGRDGTTPKQEAEKRVIVPAGDISYVQLLTELNSDIKGPTLGQILSGPFAGGRALGQFSVEGEYLVITFKRIIKDNVSYSINGIALDEATTLAGHQTDVDHHYFMRVILPAAAKFVEGYGSAVAETGTSTTTTAGGGVASDTPEPDATEEVYKGVEEAAKKLAEITEDAGERPITVKVAKGTTMGILFMDPVTTASVE